MQLVRSTLGSPFWGQSSFWRWGGVGGPVSVFRRCVLADFVEFCGAFLLRVIFPCFCRQTSEDRLSRILSARSWKKWFSVTWDTSRKRRLKLHRLLCFCRDCSCLESCRICECFLRNVGAYKGFLSARSTSEESVVGKLRWRQMRHVVEASAEASLSALLYRNY